MAYLDHACFSPPASETVRAVQAAAASLTRTDGGEATRLALDWMQCHSTARASVASLLGCADHDVTLVESTTHGLGVIAGGLSLAPGDNVVIGDCDFVGIPTVWRAHQARGVQLRAAPSHQGRLTLDALERTVDQRTQVITVSAIQEVSGWPVDLDGVAEIAASVGALPVIDAAQEAGVIHRVPADHRLAAYTAGGHKWLRNPYGLGLLWTSPNLRDRLRPPFRGYFALQEPTGGWEHHLNDPTTTALDRHVFRNDGAALEVGGTPNWLGAIGLATAVDNVNLQGAQHIEDRALHLADTLRAGLQARGINPLTHIGTRSPIVTFTTQPHGGHDQVLAEVARQQGIEVSTRAGAGTSGIRAACHAHNTEDDLHALLDVVATHLHNTGGGNAPPHATPHSNT